MSFWGSNSGDELDFGSKGTYENIRAYIESQIGVMDVNDSNLQDKFNKLLEEDRQHVSGQSFYQDISVWLGWGKTRKLEIEVKHVGNNTYLRGSEKADIDAIRENIRQIGFNWNFRQKSWILENRLLSVDEIKKIIIAARSINATKGLRAYCEKIAYRQKMNGIPMKFVDEIIPNEAKAEKADISEKNRKNLELDDKPYSKIDQLEKLIVMRNKGEISPEEFESLKKELLT